MSVAESFFWAVKGEPSAVSAEPSNGWNPHEYRADFQCRRVCNSTTFLVDYIICRYLAYKSFFCISSLRFSPVPSFLRGFSGRYIEPVDGVFSAFLGHFQSVCLQNVQNDHSLGDRSNWCLWEAIPCALCVMLSVSDLSRQNLLLRLLTEMQNLHSRQADRITSPPHCIYSLPNKSYFSAK